MNTKKKVILARPNPLIVDRMKKFLDRNGFEPVTIHDLEELKHLSSSREIKGAIISTSSISEVDEPVEEVISELNRKMPFVPVAFASLADFYSISGMLNKAISRLSYNAELINVNEKALSSGKLGRKGAFVVLQKEDLNRGEADEVIGKHFR